VKGRLHGAKREEIKQRAIDALRSAAAVVEQKAPSDAASYKAWLTRIANNVAEAAKEGGFLGFGGVDVSDAEKATLAEIAAALGHGPERCQEASEPILGERCLRAHQQPSGRRRPALAGSAVLVNRRAAQAERDYLPRGKFQTVDGVRLHYVKNGNGPPVVFLHGNGALVKDMLISGVVDQRLRPTEPLS